MCKIQNKSVLILHCARLAAILDKSRGASAMQNSKGELPRFCIALGLQ